MKPDATHEVTALPLPAGTPRVEQVVVEAPLAVTIAGNVFTVTMRTPGDDVDLARGLLLSEGALSDGLAHPVTLHENDTGTIAEVTPPPGWQVVTSGRRQTATSSCGLCGVGDLAAISERVFAPVQTRCRDTQLLSSLMARMAAAQPQFAATGGSHAAAAFTAEGKLLVVREDIGRHNAVDKVIGALLAATNLGEAAVLTVSGRISYEIVAKCLAARIGVLLAVSAPSSMAIRMAQQHGLLLAGFCRDSRLTIYAGYAGDVSGAMHASA